jgi:carboxymethylenebutenolidase
MIEPVPSQPQADAYSRRRFNALTAAAAASAGAAAAGCSQAAPAKPAAPTTSTDVMMKTADGSCEAVFVHPAGKGPWPGAVIWPDAMGLRDSFRQMAARLAAEGYAVLAVNQFYRSSKLPIFAEKPDMSTVSNPDSPVRKRLMELRGPLTPEATMRDADGFVTFLSAQPAVSKTAKMGVSGYCMGGPMTLQTAAARSDRIGASASFHGGGLVTDKPDSPHLLVPRTKADFLFAIAQNDDEQEPGSKTALKAACDAAGRKAVVEVYPGALHGWCVPDSPVYNHAAAEKAWGELLGLYKRALV